MSTESYKQSSASSRVVDYLFMYTHSHHFVSAEDGPLVRYITCLYRLRQRDRSGRKERWMLLEFLGSTSSNTSEYCTSIAKGLWYRGDTFGVQWLVCLAENENNLREKTENKRERERESFRLGSSEFLSKLFLNLDSRLIEFSGSWVQDDKLDGATRERADWPTGRFSDYWLRRLLLGR